MHYSVTGQVDISLIIIIQHTVTEHWLVIIILIIFRIQEYRWVEEILQSAHRPCVMHQPDRIILLSVAQRYNRPTEVVVIRQLVQEPVQDVLWVVVIR